ncbi:MAG TPA: hypothetical protein VHT96_16535 [Clostridia bacterium]|nr:hypothetical protein [Clostridia bacterium]
MRFISKGAIFTPVTAILTSILLFVSPVAISLAEDTAGAAGNAVSAGGTSQVTGGAGSGTEGTTGASIGIPGSAVTTGTAITTGSALTTGSAITTGSALTTGTAIISGSAITTRSAITSGSAITTTGAAVKVNDESLWYNPKIPMKKAYQELLWENCQEKELDYIDMLALISVESNFNEKCTTGKCKGYFQISSIHFTDLSKLLKTPNKPLDGTVNIKWGTTMYNWALHDKRTKGLTGKKLRDVALAIYQRGTGGYDHYGINRKYLARFYEEREMVLSWFKK